MFCCLEFPQSLDAPTVLNLPTGVVKPKVLTDG